MNIMLCTHRAQGLQDLRRFRQWIYQEKRRKKVQLAHPRHFRIMDTLQNLHNQLPPHLCKAGMRPQEVPGGIRPPVYPQSLARTHLPLLHLQHNHLDIILMRSLRGQSLPKLPFSHPQEHKPNRLGWLMARLIRYPKGQEIHMNDQALPSLIVALHLMRLWISTNVNNL